jgi:hypothetical protein
VETPPSAAPEERAPSAVGLLAGRLRRNLTGYAGQSLPTALGLPTLPGTKVDNWFWVLLVAVLLGGGAWSLRREQAGVLLYLALYAALLVCWPYRIRRFLVPVLPLLLVLLLAGALRAWPRGRRGAWVLPGLLLLALAGGGVSTVAARWRALSGCDRSAPYASARCFSPPQLGFFAAARLVAETLPATEVLLTPKAATLNYLTGRLTVDELAAAALDSAALEAFLRERAVRYIVLSRIHIDQRTIAGALRGFCRSLTLVGRPGPGSILLRLEAGEATGENGCVALAQFVEEGWREE